MVPPWFVSASRPKPSAVIFDQRRVTDATGMIYLTQMPASFNRAAQECLSASRTGDHRSQRSLSGLSVSGVLSPSTLVQFWMAASIPQRVTAVKVSIWVNLGNTRSNSDNAASVNGIGCSVNSSTSVPFPQTTSADNIGTAGKIIRRCVAKSWNRLSVLPSSRSTAFTLNMRSFA